MLRLLANTNRSSFHQCPTECMHSSENGPEIETVLKHIILALADCLCYAWLVYPILVWVRVSTRQTHPLVREGALPWTRQ
jgi:hypothetical protein